MPSKYKIGNSPLGRRIRNTSSPMSGFAQVEREIGHAQSVPNLVTRSRQLPNGTLHLPGRAQGATTACTLGNIKVDTENSTETITKYKLEPAFFTGGGSTELIQPNNLTATIDDFVWLKVLWTAEGNESTVEPGGTLGHGGEGETAITVEQGAEVPTDDIPTQGTADDLKGIAYIVLGGWISDNAEAPAQPSPVWVKQGCGAIQLYFCPGNGFFFGRDNVVT